MKISCWVLPREQYGTRNYLYGDDINRLEKYIERESELATLFQVGETIGGVNCFQVDVAYFKACLHSGRVAVHWHGQIGQVFFDMHMTLVKWDVREWRRT